MVVSAKPSQESTDSGTHTSAGLADLVVPTIKRNGLFRIGSDTGVVLMEYLVVDGTLYALDGTNGKELGPTETRQLLGIRNAAWAEGLELYIAKKSGSPEVRQVILSLPSETQLESQPLLYTLLHDHPDFASLAEMNGARRQPPNLVCCQKEPNAFDEVFLPMRGRVSKLKIIAPPADIPKEPEKAAPEAPSDTSQIVRAAEKRRSRQREIVSKKPPPKSEPTHPGDITDLPTSSTSERKPAGVIRWDPDDHVKITHKINRDRINPADIFLSKEISADKKVGRFFDRQYDKTFAQDSSADSGYFRVDNTNQVAVAIPPDPELRAALSSLESRGLITLTDDGVEPRYAYFPIDKEGPPLEMYLGKAIPFPSIYDVICLPTIYMVETTTAV